MNTNLNDYKERVKRLRQAVSSVLKIECSQSQAYELLAQEENYPNWDSLSGSLKNHVKTNNKEGILSLKEQITQLVFFYEAMSSGLSISGILKLLKNQHNSILIKGWTQAEVVLQNSGDLSLILEETKFFNHEVLTLLKITTMTGTFETSVKPAIDFLKMSYEWELQESRGSEKYIPSQPNF